MAVDSCPSRTILGELLDNALPAVDQAEVTSHLETCELCQQTLEGLAAGKDVWEGAVRQLGAEQPPFESALGHAIEKLKRETLTGASGAKPEPLSLDFLQGSDDSRSLGRLGDYEIREVLGHGGMGVVLKAFDSSLERDVAIKVLAPQLATHPTARKRFQREARAAAAIDHENVVRIHGVGEANGIPYFVMELVEGESLQDVLDRDGPPPLPTLLDLVNQIVAGLAAAHAQGLIHRDIKPANVLVSAQGKRVKITDFGLARAVDAAGLTRTGVIAGTPQYMAPEQARGDMLDHRADLFSLGSVLYALCTGKAPFQAENPLAVLRKVCEEEPTPVREVNPQLPAWLGDMVSRLMAKDVAGRPQTIQELSAWLAEGQARGALPPPTGRPSLPEAKSRRRKMPLTKCPDCGKDVSDNAATCPHCGRQVYRSYEYCSQTRAFGLPLIHIAYGYDPITGRKRVAKGIIAIGDAAVGVLAVGGFAAGGIAVGGVAIGVVGFGGLSMGLLLALGGLAVGGVAVGGLAVGALAFGGIALGYYALGGLALGVHAYGGNVQDKEALDLFRNYFGHWLDARRQ